MSVANGKEVREAFFRRIREQRAAMERQKPQAGPTVFENVVPPERLWDFLEYVGGFLLEEGIISRQDMDLAAGMIEDYEERVREVFGGPNG